VPRRRAGHCPVVHWQLLYNITSLYHTTEFTRIQNDIYGDWNAFQGFDATNPSFVQQLESKYGFSLSGNFYYNPPVDGDMNPVVHFSNPTVPNANVVAGVTASIESPDGDSNVAWEMMTGVTGQLATTIFQVFTKGGGGAQVEKTVSISRSATVECN
jgi:hypothetical protein